jgi:hypothetical protein
MVAMMLVPCARVLVKNERGGDGLDAAVVAVVAAATDCWPRTWLAGHGVRAAGKCRIPYI